MLEAFAGPDTWRTGIQAYIRRHAYQNAKTEDLWSAMEGVGAKGLASVARDFTNQPGVPLIEVGSVQCVGDRTIATITQSQFSTDQRAAAMAHPLSWHVPVRASAGGAAAQVVTQGPTTQIAVQGCGPLLINAGQTGYYRTLYQRPQDEALQTAFQSLGAVDQFGLLNDQLALSDAGYQPIAVGLDFLSGVPANANCQARAVGAPSLERALRRPGNGSRRPRPRSRARAIRIYGPRLQQLGFAPRAGEPAVDALLAFEPDRRRSASSRIRRCWLRPTACSRAWQANPNAIPGSLKTTWLSLIARNADETTWNAIRAKAQACNGLC